MKFNLSLVALFFFGILHADSQENQQNSNSLFDSCMAGLSIIGKCCGDAMRSGLNYTQEHGKNEEAQKRYEEVKVENQKLQQDVKQLNQEYQASLKQSCQDMRTDCVDALAKQIENQTKVNELLQQNLKLQRINTIANTTTSILTATKLSFEIGRFAYRYIRPSSIDRLNALKADQHKEYIKARNAINTCLADKINSASEINVAQACPNQLRDFAVVAGFGEANQLIDDFQKYQNKKNN